MKIEHTDIHSSFVMQCNSAFYLMTLKIQLQSFSFDLNIIETIQLPIRLEYSYNCTLFTSYLLQLTPHKSPLQLYILSNFLNLKLNFRYIEIHLFYFHIPDEGNCVNLFSFNISNFLLLSPKTIKCKNKKIKDLNLQFSCGCTKEKKYKMFIRKFILTRIIE